MKTAALALLIACLPLGAGWHSNSFLARIPITIQGTAVTGTLTNYPALVSISNHAALSNWAHPAGYDLRFCDGDGSTPLPHEIEGYTNGSLLAWVRVPFLQAGVSTNLYLYFNNTQITSSLENKAEVWDSNYIAVWHMGRTGLSNLDSTSNGLHGVDVAGTLTNCPGVISTAVSFDGANSQFDHGNPDAIRYATNQQTVEMWVNPSRTNLRSNPLGKSYGGEFSITYETAGIPGYSFGTAGGDASPYTTVYGQRVDTNMWTYMAFTRDFQTRNIMAFTFSTNGQIVKTNTITSAYSNATPSTKTFRIGTGYVARFPGMIDEVRLSSVARSPQWIATTYTNLAMPTSFASPQATEFLDTISITLTNFGDGAMVPLGSALNGRAFSHVGIQETRLILLDMASNEAWNSNVSHPDAQSWNATPNCPVGDYLAVLVCTNSNGTGARSPFYTLKMRAVSRLTVRTLTPDGLPCMGGRLLGPARSSDPLSGLRTNDLAGESFFEGLFSGTLVALTNFAPVPWMRDRVTTNFQMPETDFTLIWRIEAPATNPFLQPETISNRVYSLSRFPNLMVHVPGDATNSRRVVLQVTRLAGGRKNILFDGFLAEGENEIRLPTEKIRHLMDPGAWILEFRFSQLGRDESTALIYRRMLLCTP